MTIEWTKELYMVEGVEVRTGVDQFYWYASTVLEPNLLFQGASEEEVLHKVLEDRLAKKWRNE